MMQWSRKGEWSAYGLRESMYGLVAWVESGIQGTITGRKLLIPWAEIERLGYERGCDLATAYNGYMSVGAYIFECADPERCRVIRSGHYVR